MSAAARPESAAPALRVHDLAVTFPTDGGEVHAVDGASFPIPAGGAVALVGESGCGKTVTALALMGLLPRRTGRVASGSIRFDGLELVDLPPGALRAVRGRAMAMIFQEPDTSLNPAFTVGDQIAEMVRVHQGAGRRAAMLAEIEAL